MIYDYRKIKEGKRRFNNKLIYSITHFIQNILHFFGIAWHNTYSGECTKDFNCCNKDIGRPAYFRISK